MSNIRDLDGSRATAQRIADWLTAQGVPSSASHVGNLRNGYRDNPDWRILDGIADYFGVPSKYWIDEDVERQVRSDVVDIDRAARSVRGDLVNRVAALPPDQLAQLQAEIDRLQKD